MQTEDQKRKDINIIAKSIEEFASIKEALDKIPIVCLIGVESVGKGHFGLDIKLKFWSVPTDKIYLPSSTTQISVFDDNIGVYCDGAFITIKINGVTKNIPHLNYIILKEQQ